MRCYTICTLFILVAISYNQCHGQNRSDQLKTYESRESVSGYDSSSNTFFSRDNSEKTMTVSELHAFIDNSFSPEVSITSDGAEQLTINSYLGFAGLASHLTIKGGG